MVSVRFGPFSLNEAERTLMRGSSLVHLTPKAFDVLLVLVSEAPSVVTKAALHARIWPETFVSDATLVGVVKELRRALDEEEGQSHVRTVHRVGYAFSQTPARSGDRPRRPVMHWLVLAGHPLPLNQGECLIGRDPVSVVPLDAAGVSRVHARILVADDQASIQDMGSKNGTKLNGLLLEDVSPLRDGDRVDVGPITVIYRCSASGRSTETISAP